MSLDPTERRALWEIATVVAIVVGVLVGVLVVVTPWSALTIAIIGGICYLAGVAAALLFAAS